MRRKARPIASAWGIGVFTLLMKKRHLGECFMHAPAYAGQCGTGVEQMGMVALSVSPRRASQRHTH